MDDDNDQDGPSATHRRGVAPGDDTASIRDRRVRVVRAGHAGDLRSVRSGLGDPDPTVRAVAVAASLRLSVAGNQGLDVAARAILDGLVDPDASVRRRSAGVAARLPTARAEDDQRIPMVEKILSVLVTLLADEDRRTVEVAAFACGELATDDDPAARTVVLGALQATATDHDDHLCRESAVAALGSIGDERSLPTVLAACRDRANVRRRAVLALAAFDDPAATVELRRLVGDRDLQVRQAAEELLAIESGETT